MTPSGEESVDLTGGPVFALIAGGGTAGHLLPGLAVADALIARGHVRTDILFVGSARGIERTVVPDAGYEVVLLPGRGIARHMSLSALRANAGAVAGLVRAMIQGFGIVRRRRPAVVLSLGGYASAACTLAAIVRRVPLVVAEQNATAGLANRLAARFARACAVPFPGTDLPRAVVTGNPVRAGLRRLASTAGSRAAARADLGVNGDAPLVAVFSGSLGSRRINLAVAGLVPQWADAGRRVAVHHVSGRRDHELIAAEMAGVPSPGGSLDYRLVPYEDHMDRLLAAADVAVCRAGGTTVAELAAVGVPAVLVPMPTAPRDHQRANAQALVTAGGALLLEDDECTADRLDDLLAPLLDDPSRLAAMADAAATVGRPDAADAVAVLLEEHARAR
jgi:UDP-N-acetylglucosamine--N-acetylmuramyl-(pentapeptide) pyrophosphoryl-undecaprenol N-acetylglucosamine transferase